jgi:hypothetical protein
VWLVNRVGFSCIILVAAFATACAGSNDVSPSPTAPSAPAPAPSTPTQPTPPPSSCLPGGATNLRVSIVGSVRTLTWTAGANAVDYTVTIGTASGAADLVNTNTTQTTYNWSGEGLGTYYSRVHSRNACGQGPPSNEIVFN